MSWYSKVAWSEGVFLRPQHFQQQDRHHSWQLDARCRALQHLGWGFAQLEWDTAALLSGHIALSRAQGVMPDGTPFEFPTVHPLPTALPMPAHGAQHAMVYLVLPLRRPHSTESMRQGCTTTDTLREWVEDIELIDTCCANTPTPEPVEICQPRWQLRLDAAQLPGWVSLPVAQISRLHAHAALTPLTSSIPPLLWVQASHVLLGWLQELHQQLRQHALVLRQRTGTPGTRGIGEIRDFLLLLLLERNQVVLQHQLLGNNTHPERCFEYLLALQAELATLLTPGTQLDNTIPYQHQALGECFQQLLNGIQNTLIQFIAQEAIAIEIQNHQQGRYIAKIKDSRLLQTNTHFILAVKAQIPTETLRNRFPLQVKLGPVERLREIVNLQLPGLTLQALTTAPRELPLHAGFVYFTLDTQHALWQALEHSGGLGIYITGDYPNIELALWAILG